MTEKIKIYEEDIFKFVFSIEDLESYKINYIEKNYSIFETEINRCKGMLDLENEELSENEEKNLITKITNQKNIILLYPKQNDAFTNNNKLAADSLTLENKLNTYTFIDIKSEFMVRVLSQKEFTKFFVFPTKNQPQNKYKLTIYPSKIELFGQLDSVGVQTKFIPDIETIELEFLAQ